MQNKIGVLGCGYSCEDRLDERLVTWFKAAQKHNIIFSFVSARFKEYEELNINQDNTETIKALEFYKKNNLIQYLEVPEKSLLEHEARNLALKHLLDEKCDFIWLLDLSDEFYTEEQIEKIIEYINRGDNSFYSWFSLYFKNYVFTEKTWIDNFNPPRIFRVNPFGDLIYKLDSFRWDNDVIYKDPNGLIKDYTGLASKSIPKNVAFIRHLTWMDDEKSHQKVLYHSQHFKLGFGCSYNWENGRLCFNEEYYKKLNIPVPEVFKDE